MDVKAALRSLYKTQMPERVSYDDSTNGHQEAPVWLIAKCAAEEIHELEDTLERALKALRKNQRHVHE